MTMRFCDGSDGELIMYLTIDGAPADDPEFSVIGINCDCGSLFDDTKHDLVWPHRYVRPTADLPDISFFL